MNRMKLPPVLLFFITGCGDHVITVSQTIELRLTRVPSGDPAANATVDLAPISRMYAKQANLTDKEWADRHPWLPAEASSSGLASLDLRHGILHPPFNPGIRTSFLSSRLC